MLASQLVAAESSSVSLHSSSGGPVGARGRVSSAPAIF